MDHAWITSDASVHYLMKETISKFIDFRVRIMYRKTCCSLTGNIIERFCYFGIRITSGAVHLLRMISILDFYIGLEKYLLLLCFAVKAWFRQLSLYGSGTEHSYKMTDPSKLLKPIREHKHRRFCATVNKQEVICSLCWPSFWYTVASQWRCNRMWKPLKGSNQLPVAVHDQNNICA